MSKIHVFKVVYLLGIEEFVLGRNYHDDYVGSNNLGLLRQFDDVVITRALQRIKLALIRNHSKYKSVFNSIKDASDIYLKDEFEVLDKNNIELKETSAWAVVNEISVLLKKFVPLALTTLDVPYKDLASRLFVTQTFRNNKEFVAFSTEAMKENMPHGLVIGRYAKLGTSLPYSLTNNSNFFFSVHTINDLSYFSTDALENTNMDWSHYAIKDVAVDVSKVIDKGVTEVALSTDNIELCDSKVCCLTTNIGSKVVSNFEDLLFNSNIVGKKFKIYVDCDNTDFSKFIAFFAGVKNIDDYLEEIVLYIDPKSTPLWSYFSLLSDVNVKEVKLKRIKAEKSVADMVIVMDISLDIMKYGDKLGVILMSSDSDYFVLKEKFVGTDFIIGYDNSCTSCGYLKYLITSKTDSIDISSFENNTLLDKYKELFITKMLLKSLLQIPLAYWKSDTFSTNILQSFNNDCCGIDADYIESVYLKMRDHIKMNIVDGNFVISCGGLSAMSSDVQLEANNKWVE